MKFQKLFLLIVVFTLLVSCHTSKVKYVKDTYGLEKDIECLNATLFTDSIMLDYFNIDSVTASTYYVDNKIRYGFHYFYYNHAQYRMAKNNDSDFVSICMQMEKEKEEYIKQNEAIKISSNNIF